MGNGTRLGRVRGLGSARSGTHHWTLQRITAIANLALLVWLLISLVSGAAGSFDGFHSWLSSPFAAVPMALLAISAFTHLRLGLTVLIEDYLHGEAGKLAALVLLTFFSWGGMIFALFCIAKIALGAPVNVGQ
jgi:succinate dehydrogenase / fumarate reductase, membrane anchor subunit